MDMARAILERVQEVELQLTPEFQKGWPKPEVYQRTPVGPDPSGNPRYRVVYRWPDTTIVTGLAVEGLNEFNAWVAGSTVKSGGWAGAMRSIKATGVYPGGVFVYVESEEHPAYREIDAAATARAIDAHAVIKNYSPGEEPTIDHFLGYEAVPASEQPKMRDTGATGTTEPAGATGPTWGVPLLHPTKLVLINRPWMHLTHVNADVTESNPVMVLTKHLPFEVSAGSKEKVVKSILDSIGVESYWSAKLEAWRIWPPEGQDEDEFGNYVGYLIRGIDEVIDAAEEEA